MYAIARVEDELLAFREVRRAIDQLIAIGHDVTLHAEEGGTHFEACSYVPGLEAARDWLTRNVWALAN